MIVGSTALSYFRMNIREPKDLDIWTTDQSFINSEGVDGHIVPENIMERIYNPHGYCTPDQIYTIKLSHSVYPIKWEKTKQDILWLKAKGCKVIPELYERLKLHWKEVHGNKDFLSLNKNKEDFFTDAVTYVYDHDYLHELVAHPNKPMYTNCLKDGQEVLIDKTKFFTMSFGDQVRMFREEITVIAAERWLIDPYWKDKLCWYRAYILSLEKTVTSLTKGWASEFIVENLEYFVKPDYTYFEHLFKTLNLGDLSMSKVDLQVFEELAAITDERISSVVYELCNGDCDFAYEGNFEEDYQYEHLEQEGGGEGGGEYCYGVFSLKGKIYKGTYSYYSYNGHEYDGIERTLKEVKPVEKVVTVYE